MGVEGIDSLIKPKRKELDRSSILRTSTINLTNV